MRTGILASRTRRHGGEANALAHERSTPMAIAQSANLLVRFLLELGMLGSLGYWGFQTSNGLLVRIVLGLGAPLVAAVVWGTFVSPKAAIPLSAPMWILVQVAIFGTAMAALAASGRPSLAWALGVAATVNGVLMYLLGA